MDSGKLTDEQRQEISYFASAFLEKKDILKIMQLPSSKEIDEIIEIERLKQTAKINKTIFDLAANNSSEAIKQALKIIDSTNQGNV
jgi:hypothetical protein